MAAPKPYQGHRSWNAWNVSLWINNTEHVYFRARDLAQKHGTVKAARMLAKEFDRQTTPDGARYNFKCIHEAISDILS